MNEILTEALRPGETLLWSGRAGEFKAMDGNRKAQLLRRMVISLAITLAFLAVYIINAVSKGEALKPVLLVVVLFAGCYAAFSFLLDAVKIRGLVYAVTDQRILVISGETVSGAEYDKLGEYRTVKDTDGSFSFVAGKESGKIKESKLLTFAPLGVRLDENGFCRTLVLFAVSEPELFREAVTPYLK